MNKYQKGIFYIANIIKYEKGEEKIYRKNVYLIYDEETDKFISFQDVLNPSLDLLNQNLKPDEIKEIQEEIEKYKYSYVKTRREGEIYVEESSIKVVEYQLETKKSRT